MTTVPVRPTLLILSFSPLVSDARILKQIALLRNDYDVVTCGLGEMPHGVVEHIMMPTGSSAARPYGRWLTLKQYRLAYWRQTGVRWVHSALRGRRFDAVIANDVEAVPLALAIAPRRVVHADLHEYSPRMREDRPNWRRRVGVYLDWMCRHYVSRAASWTTVSSGLAAEYERVFGFRAELVTNAAPYAALSPQLVGTAPGGASGHENQQAPIRLVHSGGCLPNRGLEELVDALGLTSASVTLDLYLVPNDPALLQRIIERSAVEPRLTVHAGVPYRELISTLNGFDVGVHLLPPHTFNHRFALPNKLFDYVQARLGVISGPTPEMAEIVREYALGWVTDDFTAESLARVLNDIHPAAVDAAKRASDIAAVPLAAERQMGAWVRAIERIAPPRGEGR